MDLARPYQPRFFPANERLCTRSNHIRWYKENVIEKPYQGRRSRYWRWL
jgi:hypothetical protein